MKNVLKVSVPLVAFSLFMSGCGERRVLECTRFDEALGMKQ